MHSLYDNQIGDAGAAALGEGLKTNAALQLLACVARRLGGSAGR